ncbi:CgeB family protein [Cedecea davisae]|nr:hypothetical protein [Cedecea davisae]
MLMVSNKTVLLICPDFFDYKTLISKELENYFQKVISFPDRPVCSSISKALFKYNAPVFSKHMSTKYDKGIYRAIVNELPEITDVIIIKGTCITPGFIELLRRKNKKIRVISYSWDSVSNIKTFINLAHKSDRSFTFDIKDSLNYKINYLPLFFSEISDEKVSLNGASSETFDYTFIGSYHGDRIRVLSRFLANKEAANTYIKIYFQSYLQYIFYYLRDSALRSCPKKWITFESVPRNEVEAVSRSSRHIIDIHHHKQTGLTMRTWETLQGKHKLITTNPTVLLHSSSDLVTVIDRDSGLEWSVTQCTEYKDKIKQENPHLFTDGCLSLSAWVDALLTKS